jgi:hypothetical protein
VLGALTNDSGPELLVIGTFAVAAVLAYLWGGPWEPVEAASEASARRVEGVMPAQVAS